MTRRGARKLQGKTKYQSTKKRVPGKFTQSENEPSPLHTTAEDEQDSLKVSRDAGVDEQTIPSSGTKFSVEKEAAAGNELENVAAETFIVEEKVAEEQRPEISKGKEKSEAKRKARKRKASCPKSELGIPSKKMTKSDDIFFYCGNLPPGVTSETLRYFLEEEGINPRVLLKRMQDWDKSKPKLTAKQKLYKKNQLRAAKSVFATVIVKSEEEAKKMLSLNGIAMPSPSNIDCDTELKIVRRLPRPGQFPHKVHIGGLHPSITEDELKHYLEGHGIKAGQVVIVRNQSTQKSRRYGFVWFESVPEANKAVNLPKPFMRDRPLVIQHSFKKAFKNF